VHAPHQVLDKSAIYAKGFPAVGTTLDEILEFCSGAHACAVSVLRAPRPRHSGWRRGSLASGAGLGTVKAVRMRYTYDKPRKFKGSVFVELANEAEAVSERAFPVSSPLPSLW
jgi:hypothetical protein